MTHHHVWALIAQSDAISMAILLALLGLSIACWTVIFAKWWSYHQHAKQAHIVYTMLSNIRTFEQLLAAEAVIEPWGVGTLWSAACKAVRAQTLEQSFDITRISLDKVNSAIEEAYLRVTQELDQSLVILSISIEIAPLLGLFGTVWGLIHSFVRISMLQSADIVTVAPGIAEALITTLAGLIVAVPAVAAYHQLKKKETALLATADNIADRCELIMKQFAQQGASYGIPSSSSSSATASDNATRHPHSAY